MRSVIGNMLKSTIRIAVVGSFVCIAIVSGLQGATERDVGRELRKAAQRGDVDTIAKIIDAKGSRNFVKRNPFGLVHTSSKKGESLAFATYAGLHRYAGPQPKNNYKRKRKGDSSGPQTDRTTVINSRDSDGLTALHLASLNGCADVVGVLLEVGAQADQPVASGKYAGQTAMHMAATMPNVHGRDRVRIAEYERTLEYLVGAGENGARGYLQEYLDVEDKAGKRPLHYAALHGKRKLAIKLCELGATVNKADSEKRTPLHYAAIDRHRYTAKTLCNHQAKVNLRDVWGKTPLHRAAENDDLKMAQLLIEKGSELTSSPP